jgi:ribosomal-protein-alanine N-acetyltransferase
MTSPEKRNIDLVSLLWAGAEAAPEIAHLHASLFPEPWDAPSVTKLLEHPGATTLIARTGFPKTSVGFILGQIAADEAEILSIGVAPEWQRNGLAGKLVTGLERAVKRAGAQRVFLEVAEDNSAARALYRRCGFAETGRRKAYYARQDGQRTDAILMSKALA